MIEWFIETWGYPALLVGTFFEGETVLIVAGFAAHRGYLALPLVMLVAFIGSLSGDQLWFFIGRTRGAALLARHPKWHPRAMKVRALAQRYEIAVLLGFRFLYGLRNLTPFVLGASGFPPARFVFWNAAGAALWSVGVGAAGYLFGHAVEVVLHDVRKYELWLMAGAFIVTACIWAIWQMRRTMRRGKEVPEPGGDPIAPLRDIDPGPG